MSPCQRAAGLRGARLQAVFARLRSAGIGWGLWGRLPHFLPQDRYGFEEPSLSRIGLTFGSVTQVSLAGFDRVNEPLGCGIRLSSDFVA